MKNLVAANIEILQFVARGGAPEIIVVTTAGKEAREPKIYILRVRRAKPLDFSVT